MCMTLTHTARLDPGACLVRRVVACIGRHSSTLAAGVAVARRLRRDITNVLHALCRTLSPAARLGGPVATQSAGSEEIRLCTGLTARASAEDV